MSYDWDDAAKSTGKERAPKIPEGQFDLEIIDVVFGKKGSGPFKSNSGDSQILLVFSDGEGNEASQMYTLSGKAAFTLAKVLAASGADTKKMTEKGITPDKFADPRFATAQLKGRKFRGDVKHDGEYFRIEPLRADPTDQPKDEDLIRV
jgi:hypothetical protein